MARKELTEAEKLLNELKTIPKLIHELKLDIERTEASLLSSPKWSDMKTSGGLRQSQEDKTISVIDMTDYNKRQIDKLLVRKDAIVDLVMQIPDIYQRHVLFTTYVNGLTFDEAIDRLEMSRNTYFAIKRKGVESLNDILKDTKIH